MTGPELRFAGQVAIVTGGSAGLGLAAAAALRAEGAAVALWARDPGRLAAAAGRLTAAEGPPVITVECDVSRAEAVRAAVGTTVAALHRIDACVVNAGTVRAAGLLETTAEDWRYVQAVNLDGAFSTLQAVARVLVDQGDGGAFCVVSSIAARRGAPHAVAYTASKTGVVGLARSAAAGLAPHGIRVNVVLPGFVRTHPGDDPARARRDVAVAARTPVGRLGESTELTALLTYLCDKRFVFHTGDVITVDGGYLLD